VRDGGVNAGDLRREVARRSLQHALAAARGTPSVDPDAEGGDGGKEEQRLTFGGSGHVTTLCRTREAVSPMHRSSGRFIADSDVLFMGDGVFHHRDTE
jgi:hypothetical protein